MTTDKESCSTVKTENACGVDKSKEVSAKTEGTCQTESKEKSGSCGC